MNTRENITAPHDHQTIIIGAGPIGIELAACLKHAGHDYLHLEAGQVGQTITWYPKQVKFFSSPERIAIAGLPLSTPNEDKATREQYLAYLRSVVSHHHLHINTFERVVEISRQKDGRFAVFTQTLTGEPHTYTCINLVLAIGDMHGPHKLGIEGEDLAHVSHYFDEPHQYFGKRLLIVGGKNSAVEAAIRCFRAGADVTLAYRRETFDKKHVKYWLYPEIKSLIKAGQIKFLPNIAPTRIDRHAVDFLPVKWEPQPGQDIPAGYEEKMIVDHSAAAQRIETDFVLLLTGYVQDETLFQQLGVQLLGLNRQPTFDPKTMMTNVDNVFVAGTAIGGTQKRFMVFIENCHVHAARITKAITGQAPDHNLLNDAAAKYALPES